MSDRLCYQTACIAVIGFCSPTLAQDASLSAAPSIIDIWLGAIPLALVVFIGSYMNNLIRIPLGIVPVALLFKAWHFIEIDPVGENLISKKGMLYPISMAGAALVVCMFWILGVLAAISRQKRRTRSKPRHVGSTLNHRRLGRGGLMNLVTSEP